MEILRKSDPELLSDLRIQTRKEGRTYRWNKLCYMVEVPEGTLVLNGMTRSIVMIRKIEFRNVLSKNKCDYAQFLMENYFLVPEDYDEFEVVEAYRKNHTKIIHRNYLDNPSAFVILTTTKCNARCSYCYEKTLKNKSHMSEDMAEKIADYIINNHDEYMPVSISWFGGEPLYNQEVIDLISNRLMAADIEYNTSIVSNALLFDEVIDKVVPYWHIKQVQVTLDGTEENYNRIKNYVGKIENPYARVIDNIKKLLEREVSVSIRLNCDLDNCEDLKKLVQEIDRTIVDNRDFLSMYVFQIFGERDEEYNTKLFKELEEITQLIIDKNLGGVDRILDQIKHNHCMVDSANCVVITPNGDLGTCEHYIDSKFFSSIDNPNIKNFDVIKEWRDYTPPTERCLNCPIYAECLRVKGCTDEKRCDEAEQKYELYKIKMALLHEWKEYKKIIDNPVDNECEKCEKN